MLICILPLDLIYVHVAVGDGIDGQCRHAFQAELVHDVFAMGAEWQGREKAEVAGNIATPHSAYR